MKNYINKSILMLFIIAFAIGSCNDERALVIAPDSFEVKISDHVKVLSDSLKVLPDTFVVNVNEKVTFNFPAGCPDQILFYSGESGLEYRFGNRSNYQSTDGSVFESKITTNTAVNSFDALISKDYSLAAVIGLNKSTATEFKEATKIELMKLRATSTNATSLTDNFTINSSTTQLNLSAGDLNLALVAKSADATKNMLSISALGFGVTNSEIRDYGFVKKGLTVLNKKTISYPVITNTFSSAAWAQYAPDSTIAIGTTNKVLNASGYAWNLGEIGETKYLPKPPTIIYVGTTILAVINVPLNNDSVRLASSYPISVTAPVVVAKKVAAGTTPSESWLICRGINPAAVTPDPATVVKRVDQSSMLYYQYIYKERGVYKASFVGINVGTNGTSKVVREFVILVKNKTDNL
jgi:hypothetical protein